MQKGSISNLSYQEILVKTNERILEKQLLKLEELRSDSYMNMCIDPVKNITTANHNINSSIKAGDKFIVLTGEREQVITAGKKISGLFNKVHLIDEVVQGSVDYKYNFTDTPISKNNEVTINQDIIKPSLMSQTSDALNIMNLSAEEKEGIIQGVENALDNCYDVSENDFKMYQDLIQERSFISQDIGYEL